MNQNVTLVKAILFQNKKLHCFLQNLGKEVAFS